MTRYPRLPVNGRACCSNLKLLPWYTPAATALHPAASPAAPIGAIMAMPALTRRRYPERRDCWHVDFVSALRIERAIWERQPSGSGVRSGAMRNGPQRSEARPTRHTG